MRPRRGRRRRRLRSALQQIAAGRRLPVDHLAGDEDARARSQHETLVDLLPANPAAPRRSRARSRRCRQARPGTLLCAPRAPRRRAGIGPASRIQADRDRRQMRRLAQEGRQRSAAAAVRAGAPALAAPVRLQIDDERRSALRLDGGAKRRGRARRSRRPRSPRAVTTASARARRHAERPARRLDRRAGKAFAERRGPIDAKADVGRAQRRDPDAGARKECRPSRRRSRAAATRRRRARAPAPRRRTTRSPSGVANRAPPSGAKPSQRWRGSSSTPSFVERAQPGPQAAAST